ncbi:MAG: ribonuclease D [Longimicrobiales bacterium]
MEYIEGAAALEALALRLHETNLLAADTEAAGYHRFRDRVCLLQLSTRTETFVVDTLAVPALTPLATVFGDDKRELVFHDADYDLRLLNRDFGLRVRKLFDTKLAAQFLGEPAFGLGALAEKYLGIALEKKHQRADWAQRPLPAPLLEYAAEDTRHLPALRDRLRELLTERGRLHWAEEEFRLVQDTRWLRDGLNNDAYLKVKGARDLNQRQLAALRELHAWREEVAEARDAASFRVLSNDGLLEIARLLPTNALQLAGLKGVSASLIERRAPEMIGAVRRALELSEQTLPAFPRAPRRPPPDPSFDERMDRIRRVRDQAADELGLDRGFLMPRTQLEALARQQPKSAAELGHVPDIRQWQVEILADRLLGEMT